MLRLCMCAVLLLTWALPVWSKPKTKTAPSRAEQIDALATVFSSWNALLPGPATEALATPTVLLLYATAHVPFGTEPTAADAAALTAVQTELLQRGIETRRAASVSTATFRAFQCKSRQTEARMLLRTLVMAERSSFDEHEVYGDANTVGLPTPSSSYVLTLSLVDKGYRAVLTGSGAMAGDVWTVSDTEPPTNTSNACAAITADDVAGALPALSAPTEEAMTQALATFSTLLAAEPNALTTTAVFALALHALGVDGAPTVERIDTAKLDALVARVKAAGGDLTSVLAPGLDTLAASRCTAARAKIESTLRWMWNAWQDEGGLLGTEAMPFEIETRGSGEDLVITARGTGFMKGDVWKIGADGLVRPQKDLCAQARWWSGKR